MSNKMSSIGIIGLKNRWGFLLWEDLKTRMFKMYRPTQEGTLCARFLGVKQEGMMVKFIKNFFSFQKGLTRLDAFIAGGNRCKIRPAATTQNNSGQHQCGADADSLMLEHQACRPKQSNHHARAVRICETRRHSTIHTLTSKGASTFLNGLVPAVRLEV